MDTTNRIPRPALILGWLGVLPFFSFAVMSAMRIPVLHVTAASALVLYGAVILAFMGGAQWGLAMASSPNESNRLAFSLSISVTPALAGFSALFLPTIIALLGLAVAFIGLLAYDMARARTGAAPAWYSALRSQLTAAVVLCLMAGVFAAT